MSIVQERDRRRRERWYDDGAPWFQQALKLHGLADKPPAGHLYACPCCLITFPREAIDAGVLTDEHVPPEKLGGRRILLTCERCNSGSGTNFDSHAVREAAFRRFASNEGGGPLRADIFAGDVFVRGEVYRTGTTGVFMVGVPKRNDPAAMDAHMQALDSMTQDGGHAPDLGFTITEKFLPERAKVSWIRAAYLAAFAALGWLYALQPELQPIRDQLKYPDEKILPALTSCDANAPNSRRQIHLIHEPADVRCVLVSMGQCGVFLPGLGNPLSCAELSQEISRRVGGSQGMLNIHFDHAQEVPWPSWPTYIWDREIQRRQTETVVSAESAPPV